MNRHAFAAVVAFAMVTGAVPALTSTRDVTIRVRTISDAETSSYGLELIGTVASGRARERVELLAKECGPAFMQYRLVAATTTRAGGAWRIATGVPPDDFDVPVNSYFRARWRGRLSATVLNKVRMPIEVRWDRRSRTATVAVSAALTGLSLRGRRVVLQRRLRGTNAWTRVRSGRLGGARRGLFPWPTFGARFVVRTRGLTLRVVAPPETGAPCFSGGVSATFRS